MLENVQDYEDGKFVNVAQVILLNIALTVSLAVALGLGGYSFVLSAIAAWLGGSIMTMSSLAAVYWVRTQGVHLLATATQDVKSHRSPPLVSKDITEPMHLWEADRILELDHAYERGAQGQKRRAQAPSLVVMAQVWADDAADDAAQDRRMQSERRKTTSPGRTDRRGAAG